VACWGEVVLAHGVEGTAACEVVADQEDVGVELYQVVHPADHQRAVECFQDAHLEEHLEAQPGGHLED